MNDYEFYCFSNILNKYESGEYYLKPIVDILYPKYLVYLLSRGYLNSILERLNYISEFVGDNYEKK